MAGDNVFVQNLKKVMEEPEKKSSREELLEELSRKYDELFEAEQEEEIRTGNLFEHEKQSRTESENFFECERQEQAEETDMNDIITLTDADGKEVLFEFLDLVEYEGEKYALLLPLMDDDGMVMIMRVEEGGEDSDKDSCVPVESKDISIKVLKIYKDKLKAFDNF